MAALFTKLGVIGFGGPAAHIALMRDEVVQRRHWMEDREFVDWVGATNLIPGPNSTELAIHLGHRRAGGRGLLTAGICFIAPAVVIVAVLAWLYRRYGTDPTVLDLRYGILPVIIAVVAHALYGLGRTALSSVVQGTIAAAALAAYLLDVHELLILATAGGYLWHGGHLLVLWQPAEFLIIGGCAIGILVTSTPMGVLHALVGQIKRAFTPPPGRKDYEELLVMMYQLFRTAQIHAVEPDGGGRVHGDHSPERMSRPPRRPKRRGMNRARAIRAMDPASMSVPTALMVGCTPKRIAE